MGGWGLEGILLFWGRRWLGCEILGRGSLGIINLEGRCDGYEVKRRVVGLL